MLGGQGQRWTVEQQVNKLRASLTRRHIPTDTVTGDQLATVLQAVGDLELAADAMSMYPRPDWLVLMVGQFPVEAVMDLELTEMRHPDDRANTGEWGHTG